MPWGSATERLRAFKATFGSGRVANAPSTLYLALLRQATPGDVATVLGAEPDATGGYARLAFANDDATWTYTATGGSNAIEMRFAAATGLYSITDALNQWAMYDNAAGGALVAFGPLSTPLTVTGAGDQPVIPIGDLDLDQAA